MDQKMKKNESNYKKNRVKSHPQPSYLLNTLLCLGVFPLIFLDILSVHERMADKFSSTRPNFLNSFNFNLFPNSFSTKNTDGEVPPFSTPPTQLMVLKTLALRAILFFGLALIADASTKKLTKVPGLENAGLIKPMVRIVKRFSFHTPLRYPIYLFCRYVRGFYDPVDEVLIVGGSPALYGAEILFAELEGLDSSRKLTGTVNMQDEWPGDVDAYKNHELDWIYLPEVDHYQPSADDLLRACQFIEKKYRAGERVYLHCRAGHGRAGAVALAWYLYKEVNIEKRRLSASEENFVSESPEAQLMRLNKSLLEKRKVRKTLWRQDNLKEFQKLLTPP